MKKILSHKLFERYLEVVRKIFRYYEMDADSLHCFSKKQKQELFFVTYDLPVVKAEKENTIPRRIVDKIREQLIWHMKLQPLGDPENKLMQIDYMTVGAGFFVALRSAMERKSYAEGSAQATVAQTFCDKYVADLTQNKQANYPQMMMDFLTRSYSQVNYRSYSFRQTYDILTGKSPLSPPSMRIKVLLLARPCEVKAFTHHNVERKAYRVLNKIDESGEAVWSTIALKYLFPHSDSDRRLNIYIQPHALHRYKERMNVLYPSMRNYCMQMALTTAIEPVQGKQTMLQCSFGTPQPSGYFTFFIEGDDLVVNTFLPLVNELTPPGKKLHALLPLAKDDMVYLGMDKLDFFLKIDFEQVPLLKQALIDSEIWPVKLDLESVCNGFSELRPLIGDEKKTQIVKQFFDKLVQHHTDSFTENEEEEEEQEEQMENEEWKMENEADTMLYGEWKMENEADIALLNDEWKIEKDADITTEQMKNRKLGEANEEQV